MATIDRHYFRVCLAGARAQGCDAAALLRSAGVDPASLDQAGWRGSTVAMARLVRRVIARLDDESLGFVAQPIPRGAFAFAAGVAREGTSVLDGLARAVRFANLAARGIETRLVEAEGQVTVSARFADPSLDPERYFAEFWLMGWHRLACWLAAETVPLLGAEFDGPPPAGHLDELRRLFPCPHRFGAERRLIRMEARALHGPVRRTPAELEEMLAAAPLQIMTVPAGDHSLKRRVRHLLTRDPGLDGQALATALGRPLEALRKQLRREGETLTAIREDHRRLRAMRALADGNRSVEAIAADLGYAEARSFTRAFRAWTGVSPSAFRRRGVSRERTAAVGPYGRGSAPRRNG